MMVPDFSHETRIGMFPLAGVDEAGCGAWAGPVVAAAVIFLDLEQLSSDLHVWIQDSKKLTPLKRAQAYQRLCAYPEAILWNVGISSVEEIEQLNIRKATFLAMKRAVDGLSVQPKVALVDGIAKPTLKGCDVHMLAGGDSKSLSVAAASIVAKVTRDRLMEDLHIQHPQFAWNQNKGYGTQAHQEALKTQGVTLHHRRGYAPIACLLEIMGSYGCLG
ncbi:MAG: ribonuclease HII [Alphaproteobacteria bacterium]